MLVVAGLSLLACQRTELEMAEDAVCPPPADIDFYAEIEQADTKAYADEDLKVLWHADDCVSIFNRYTYNRKYRFQGKTGANAGVFKAEPLDGGMSGNYLSNVYALYPYRSDTYMNYDQEVYFYLPETQVYSPNSFGVDANFMVSATTDNHLLFKNIGGYLVLQLYGEGVSVSKIRLTGNNAEPLSGEACVYAQPDNDPGMWFSGSTGQELTLVCEEPVRLGATPEQATEFWFVLPPMEFSHGFTVTVYDKWGHSFAKSTDNQLYISRNYRSRMSPFEVVMPVQPDNEIWYTTEDGELVQPYSTETIPEFWSHVVSNEYVDGRGVITLDGPLYEIPDDAFVGVSTELMTSLDLPGSVRSIGENAFNGSTRLTELYLPEGLEKIGYRAFSFCISLKRVYVPGSVKSFGSNPFIWCDALSVFEGPYASEDGRCLVYEGEMLSFAAEGMTEYRVPEGIQTIGTEAFGWAKLLSVDIPEWVQEIGDQAFNQCWSLERIELHEGLKVIRGGAFTSCSSLLSIEIPSTVNVIEEGAFTICRALESFSGKYASEDGRCLIVDGTLIGFAPKDLEEYSVPEGVTRIGPYAFTASPVLRLVFPATVESLGYQSVVASYLESLTFLSTTPPIWDDEEMASITNVRNAAIYVPAESYDAYCEAPGWSTLSDKIRRIGTTYYDVSFPEQEASGAHLFTSEMDPVLNIAVRRANTQGALTVPVEAEFSEDGVFTLGEINFLDGQEETMLTLSFENAAFGTTYTAHIEIADPEFAATTGNSIDLSVTRVEMKYFLNPLTGEKAKIHWQQSWWGEEVDTYLKYYEVNGIRTCITETIPDSHYYNSNYYTGYGFFGQDADEASANEWTLIWYTQNHDSAGHDLIRIPLVNTGWHHSTYDADVYVFDAFYNNVGRYLYSTDDVEAEFLAFAADNDGIISYYDGNGGFNLFIGRYWIFEYGANGGGWNVNYFDITGQAEGFDFHVTLSTDFTAGGSTPVYVETSKEAEWINYAVFAGVLNEEEIAESLAYMREHPDGTTRIDEFATSGLVKTATLELTPDLSGQYTVLAISYSDGQPRDSGSVVIYHVTEADTDEYAVKLQVWTEDVGEVAEGLTTENSFIYWFSGEDVSELHARVLPTSQYNQNPSQYNSDVRNNDYWAFGEDLLSLLNGGNMSMLARDLEVLTSYTVLVWATNGITETWLTAEYETSGKPFEFICQGTYSYAWGSNTAEMSLYRDPNSENTYVFTDWGGGVNFRFTMVDNEISFNKFYTGEDDPTNGMLYYVDPFAYEYSDRFADDESYWVHSYYDPDGDVFYFHFVRAVDAGWYGHYWDSFTPNRSAGAAPASVKKQAPSTKPASALGKLTHAGKSKAAAKPAFIRVKRNPKPIQVKATVTPGLKNAAVRQKAKVKSFGEPQVVR